MIDYLRHGMDSTLREATIEKTIRDLEQYVFGTIAVRGVSGMLVGPIVAYRMKKELCVVRKPDEGAHSRAEVEGSPEGEYIVIDDFIATGRTLQVIIAAMNKTGHKCAGFYGYEPKWWGCDAKWHLERFSGVTPLNHELQRDYHDQIGVAA